MSGDRCRSTHWVYTHFLHDDCDDFPNKEMEVENTKTVYKVVAGGYQTELTKDGKRHIQGWVIFDKEVILSTLKGLFCKTIHWEKMQGTVEDSIRYCTKEFCDKDPNFRCKVDGTERRFGSDGIRNPHGRGGKGARNDLQAVIDLVDEGNTLKDVASTCPEEWIKFNRGIQSYHSMVQKDWVEQEREFIIMWGESGTGKSWQAKRIIGEDSYYIPEMNNSGFLSFETYDSQKWILIEEFKGMGLFIDDLKRMTDRYKCILRGRGCSKQALHTGLIITSQVNPASWYPNDREEDRVALLRRVTQLWQMSRKYWLNQLTGNVMDNPCGLQSQNELRTFAQLPTLPTNAFIAPAVIQNSGGLPREARSIFSSPHSGTDTILKNGKKRRLDDEFEQVDFIDLR